MATDFDIPHKHLKILYTVLQIPIPSMSVYKCSFRLAPFVFPHAAPKSSKQIVVTIAMESGILHSHAWIFSNVSILKNTMHTHKQWPLNQVVCNEWNNNYLLSSW